MSKRSWVPLGILTWNTRIGLGFTADTWEWVRKNIPVLHVILLQEIRDVYEVANVLGPDWFVWPQRNPGRKATTMVAIRRRRFKLLDSHNWPLHIGKHDREITTVLVDDKRSNRHMLFGSLHVDPLGKGFLGANVMARARHIKQVRAWAKYILGYRSQKDGRLPFVGGDFNEQMDGEDRVAKVEPKMASETAIAQFRSVGMVAAHRISGQTADFDDVFGLNSVPVVRRRTVEIPRHVDGAEHLDHPLVYVCYRVGVLDD